VRPHNLTLQPDNIVYLWYKTITIRSS